MRALTDSSTAISGGTGKQKSHSTVYFFPRGSVVDVVVSGSSVARAKVVRILVNEDRRQSSKGISPVEGLTSDDWVSEDELQQCSDCYLNHESCALA